MWVKLDDHFTEHPKVADLGPIGLAIHVTGIVYCGRNLTDGFVPRVTAHQFVGGRYETVVSDGTPVEGEVPWWSHIPELVESGVWHDEATVSDCATCLPHWPKSKKQGYYIHDYLIYNWSREQVEQDREKARKRMDRARSVKVRTNNGTGSGAVRTKGTVSSDNPAPAPEPDSETTSKTLVAQEARRGEKKAPRISETESYNLDALRGRSPIWERLGESGVTKLNGIYGLEAVSEALMRARSTDLDPDAAYPYLEAICKELVSEVVT